MLFLYSRIIFLISIVVFAICCRTSTEKINFVSQDSAKKTQNISVATAKTEDSLVSMVGTGDILLGTSYPDKNSLPPNNDCNFELADVLNDLKNADVTFGNLEGGFADNLPITKTCNNPAVCYTFRMPEKYVFCLKDAGYDLLSMANNHIFDMGQAGVDNTIKVIEAAGLKAAGTLKNKTVIFESRGLKFGFCAFAPDNSLCDMRNIEKAAELVKQLSAETDIVIVSFHGGAEGKSYQNVTRKTEMFLGENRGNVYEFSHKMIEAGADVVFGHGPHVTRAVEVYKNRFIAYSLGNFCTYSRISISGVNGLAPIIKVFTDKTGKFQSARIISTYQESGKGVKLDSQKRVLKIIQNLTKQDFPEVKLQISDDGIVTLAE